VRLRTWTGQTAPTAVIAAGLLLSQGAFAAAGYDGSYRGESSLTRGGESVCGRARFPMTVTVVNGQFAIVWNPAEHVGVNLVVEPGGSFTGSQEYFVGRRHALLKASGRVAGNALDAHIEGEYCARDYHLTES
jgi:hypothetical protein